MEILSNRKQHWNYLDKDYYLRECALAGVAVPSLDPVELVSHYRTFGGRFVLSPNAFFDEKRYRMIYPSVEAEVQRGNFRSGFDHYEQQGSKAGYSPAWFFLGTWYVARYGWLTEQELKFQGFADSYSHFLANGLVEGLGGMWLTAAVAEAKLNSNIPLSFEDLRSALTRKNGRTDWMAPLFDSEWWAAKYGGISSDACISHYLQHARISAQSPSSTFDEVFYRRRYPDVADDIDNQHFECGFHHFIQFGMVEGRQPLEVFDTNFYLTANAASARECRELRIAPYIHFLKFRKGRTLRLEPPFAMRACGEESGKTIFERKALVLAELNNVKVGHQKKPKLSIIIVARNMYAETVQCIQSIVAHTTVAFEIIIFDNASEDNIVTLPALFPAIRYIRAEKNLGFTIPVNRAAEVARGEIILLLNNDIELAPGAVDRAVERLDSEPSIGIIGGRIIRTHGMLQEAGSIVWADGTCLGYGRNLSPHHGSVLFERDVDYCSGCFLAIRIADWRSLGGFDEAFAPAYYEETDLCLRVWEMGKRVVYDPAIVLWHFEYGSSKLQEDAIALMRRNQNYFQSKHKAYLRDCFSPASANVEVARLRLVESPRLLFIEDSIPKPRTGQGFVRSAKVASILQRQMGFTTLVGLNPPAISEAASFGRTEIRPEVNHETFPTFLQSTRGVYNIVWLSRTHNIKFLAQYLKQEPTWRLGVRIIVDTEAIAALRMSHQAMLMGVNIEIDELLTRELEGIEMADHVCVVNEVDRRAVSRYFDLIGVERPISILGHAIEAQRTFPAFSERSTILITGSFISFEGPNADGFRWFDKQVRPLLDKKLLGVKYVIAGFCAQKFCDHLGVAFAYTIFSDLNEMDDVYRNARVVVAPTRFAGGIPFKAHEAASFGVPIVITDLLASQLGWVGDEALAIASMDDPEGFARRIILLYESSEAWSSCQTRQLERIEQECSSEAFEATIRDVCQIPYEETRARPRPSRQLSA